MIKDLQFIAPHGTSMPLIPNDYFILTDIDGFTTADSELATVTIPFVDGDVLNNIQARAREVTLYLRLKQDMGIETAKQYVLQFVKLKRPCKLYMERDGKPLELAGVVSYINLARFEQGCTMQISIHCSQPYWTDVDYIVAEVKNIIGLHHFPLAFPQALPFGYYDDDTTQSVNNRGDVACGMRIHIIALDEAVNPKISNAEGEYIGINDTLGADDEIVISTFKGAKTITKNGTNILNKIMAGSTFLQLETGINEFHISADSGLDSVYFRLVYKGLYI
jgi:hypothetical protein